MAVTLSFVIPVYDEAASLRELAEGIVAHVPVGETFEILMIDDGSTDGSWEIIVELARRYPCVRGLRLLANYGKSAALACGFLHAKGEVIITMDSDLQDDPKEIPRFLETLRQGPYDLVCGWRRLRSDNLEKRAASGIFNRVVRAWTGVKLHDMNIGYKCFTRDVARALKLSSDMHRFLPVLARDAGFKRFAEIEIEHHPRRYGRSKYGWARYRRGLFDLLTVMFLARCRRRPMQFFGPIGLAFLGLGVVSGMVAIVLAWEARPWPAVAALLLAWGAACSGLLSGLLGLIGELVVAHQFDPRSEFIICETTE